MLVTIPHNHRYWLEPGDRWSFFWIAFSGQEAMRLHHAILNSVGPVFRLSAHSVEQLAEICLKLRDEVDTAGQASGVAYDASMVIHDDIVAHEDLNTSEERHQGIDRTIAHIKNNLSSKLEVDQLAAVAHMSRAHYSRIFKKQTGMSPAEFVVKERMERAAKLLSGTRLSVKQVSDHCGFSDPNYFSKAFRRTYSTSPIEFRTTGMFSSGK